MVLEYKFLATQSLYIWILPSMTFHVSLHLAPGDESLATQSTMIWILSSMNLLVSLYVVQGYETLATQISIILILPSDFVCVSSDVSWRSIPCHTGFSVIDSLSF